MDTKTLFHNPDSLSDAELNSLRVKLWRQSTSPYMGGICGVLLVTILSKGVYRRTPSIAPLLLGAGAGYYIGC